VNIVLFCLVFLALELAHRSFAYIAHGRSFFRQKTFITPWISTYDYPPPFTGRDGKPYFRHRTIPTSVEKAAGTFRIIAVGGSTTANEESFRLTGIDYSLALEKKLSEALSGTKIEVLNAGGNAYSTAQSLINIELRLVEYNPDIILLMHNINDCSVNFFNGGATSDYANKYLKSYFLSPSLQGTLSASGFLTQSRFLVWIGLPQIFAEKSGDLNPEADYRPGIRFFRRNIVSIAGICRENGIRLILLSQPYSMEPHRFVSQAAFLAYDQVIAEIAKEQEIDFFDMFSEFGHEKGYFVDEFHYSPEGIERFSDIVFEKLKPMIEGAVNRQSPDSTAESAAPEID
jgi:lysophospholipase L1-like esterase